MYGSVKNERSRERERENVLKRNVVMENRKREDQRSSGEIHNFY